MIQICETMLTCDGEQSVLSAVFGPWLVGCFETGQAMRKRRTSAIYVAVVSDNPETIDGLHSYLSGAGVAAHSTRTVRNANTVPLATTAVVIFPDEFAVDDVVTGIRALRAARPRVLILVVTAAPQRLSSALAPDKQSPLPIVLPKPTFGWTILDAIRAHANSDPS